MFKKFLGLEMPNCPFVNLPQRDRRRWGEGLTAEKMVECRWLKPRLIVQIEYADWTDGNHLRHSKFVALRDDQDVGDVGRANCRPPNKPSPSSRRSLLHSII